MNYKIDLEEYLDWVTEDIKSNWLYMSEEQQQTILDILDKSDYYKYNKKQIKDESLHSN